MRCCRSRWIYIQEGPNFKGPYPDEFASSGAETSPVCRSQRAESIPRNPDSQRRRKRDQTPGSQFPPLPRFASSKNPLGRVRGGRPPPGTFVCANIPPSNRSCGIGAKHKRNGTISSGIVHQGRWPMYPIRGIAFVAWKFPVIMKCQNPGFGVPSHSL